jgi:integrase
MESKNIALSTVQMKELFGGSGYTSKQQMAVDFLHIAYWLNGANFADIATLKHENIDNNHIVFSRLKTKGRSRIEIRVKLTKALKGLIKKYENRDKNKGAYLFPFLVDCPTDEESISKKIDAEKHLIMHALAKVKTKLGLTELNFNVIRHTFATQTYYSTNHDLYGVCKALGHNDIRTTQNYLDSIVIDGTEEPITKAKEELLNQFIKE